MIVVEDEERGLKYLVVDCEDPMRIFAQRILEVPTPPGAICRRLLHMHRTLVHGAFVLDEAGKSVLLHDTLALTHLDINEVQGTIDALSLALAEHAQVTVVLYRECSVRNPVVGLIGSTSHIIVNALMGPE
jgi:hypothetical protein